MEPKLSYGAKTFLLELAGEHQDRREFLKKSAITVAGFTFLALVFDSGLGEAAAPDGIVCSYQRATHISCYNNCYCDCHGDCGRKGW